jgi:hypothetical protein
MPFLNVCRTESDKFIHIPSDKVNGETMCGEPSTDPHTSGKQGGPYYTLDQACQKCWKAEFPNTPFPSS